MAECTHATIRALAGGVCPICAPAAAAPAIAKPDQADRQVKAPEAAPANKPRRRIVVTSNKQEASDVVPSPAAASEPSPRGPAAGPPPPPIDPETREGVLDLFVAMRVDEAEKDARARAKARAGKVGGELSGRVVNVAERAARIRLAEQTLARRRLSHFARFAWPHLMGDTELAWADYLTAICDHVQSQLEDWARARKFPAAEWVALSLEERERILRAQNAIVNLPPRCLKTTLVTVMATAWAWLRWPAMEITTLSSNPRVTADASKDFMKLVRSSWYRQLADAEADARERELDNLPKDAEPTGRLRWTIPKDAAESNVENIWADGRKGGPGGVRKARGLDSAVTGEGADWQIIDDPIDADDVYSETVRSAVNERYDRAVFSRVNDNLRSIRTLIMQRLHVDDLTAHVLENKAVTWRLLVLQMEYDGPRYDPAKPDGADGDDRVGTWLGWRDPRGATTWTGSNILHPERFTPEFLAGEKAYASKYAAQYQQNPTDLAGGMFKPGDWKFWIPSGFPTPQRSRPEGCTPREERPARVVGRRPDGQLEFDWVAISVDATFKKTDNGSRVGLLVIGGIGKDRFVIHDASRRMDFPDTKRAIRALVGCGIGLEDVYASALAGCRRRITKVLIELKANGDAIVSELGEKVEGVEWPARVGIIGLETGADGKLARAVALSDTVQGGSWYLLDGAPWLDASAGGDADDLGFMPELCAFPNGRRDDRVDSLSQCHNHYVDAFDVGTHQRAWC